MSSNTSTTSIVKTLTSIVDSNIDKTKTLTINKVLLYKAGSTLTAVDLGKLSN